MKIYNQKNCFKCKRLFQPLSGFSRYCGSRSLKLGCAYEVRITTCRKSFQKHYENNKASYRKKVSIRRKEYKKDPSYRASIQLRKRLWTAIKTNKETAFVLYLGCSIPDWKEYLEKQFNKGMTWENYGSCWHIDHILPISYFDLTKQEEIKKAFNYKNTQPLLVKDNLKKSNKVVI